jgi:hypothetical protein
MPRSAMAPDRPPRPLLAETLNPVAGYFAYCQDPDGNLFGLMQADKNAK